MSRKLIIRIAFLVLALSVGCATAALAQPPGDKPPPLPGEISDKSNRNDEPDSMRDMLVRARIEREKKEHDEMIERGKQAADLSAELEKSFDDNKSFTADDLEKLDKLEKLVKRIRTDLGGEDDGEDPDEVAKEKPATIGDAFKSLKASTGRLVDELEKTTRFSISAAAIETSNSVMRLTRFLRFWN